MRNRILIWFLLAAILFLVAKDMQNPKDEKKETKEKDFEITLDSDTYSLGSEISASVKNNTDKDFEFKNNCPNTPFIIEKNGKKIKNIKSKKTDFCEGDDYLIEKKSSLNISLSPWIESGFTETGKYEIFFEDSSYNFEIEEKGFWRVFWNTFFYQPVYNILIFLTSVLPFHSLGWAIIILTILIKLALINQNKKAIESQKNMQRLQPKLEELKKKYSANQKKQSEEIMKLWKTHKINPLGSCLPILIQAPIMIAVFQVAKGGLLPHNNILLYSFQKTFDITKIDKIFLWIFDLSSIPKNDFILLIFPISIGILQYFQMAMMKKKNKKEKQKKKKEVKNAMQESSEMMLKIMPFMVAGFSLLSPAAVGLYWGASTFFAIIQQYFLSLPNKNKKEKITIKKFDKKREGAKNAVIAQKSITKKKKKKK